MTGMRQRLSVAGKVVVGCISITVGVLLGLWCVVLCVWSFLPSNAGAALPRVDAHFSVQLVLALVGLTIVVLVAVAGFGVTQEGIKRAASVALVTDADTWTRNCLTRRPPCHAERTTPPVSLRGS